MYDSGSVVSDYAQTNGVLFRHVQGDGTLIRDRLPLRIAINASFRLHGGGEHHIRQLLRAWRVSEAALRHRFLLFVRPEDRQALREAAGPNVEFYQAGTEQMGVVEKVAWEQFTLPGMLRRHGADVLFCPGNTMPLRSSIPTVVVFQNAAPFCEGITLRSTGWHDWIWFRATGAMMRAAARHADRIIFISEYFRDLFVQRFGFDATRGDVIYHGCDAGDGRCAKQPALAFGKPFALMISHLYPYKNIPALIDGYALARSEMQQAGLRLVMVGRAVNAPHFARLREQVQRLGLEDWVLFPGLVPHEELRALLTECEFFVFQSTCENCPNTLIEALAAGVPIACSSAGPMPEIAGGAALYFDPWKPNEIAAALQQMTKDASVRETLRARARERLQQLPTWQEVGEATLDVLLRAAERAPDAAPRDDAGFISRSRS